MSKKILITMTIVLAVIAAIVYFLAGAGILIPGDLQMEDAPPLIAYIAGACYLAGGLLILVRKRWLWIIGAIINGLVIILFFAMYAGQPSVMLSIPGLTTKISQVLLEIGLVYLIIIYGKQRCITK